MDMVTLAVILSFVGLNLLFSIKFSAYLGVIIGLFGFGAGVATATNVDVPLYPFLNLLLLVTGVYCMIANGIKIYGDRT